MALGPGVASSNFSCPLKRGWSRSFGIYRPLTIGVSRKIPFGYPLPSKRVCLMLSSALVCNWYKTGYHLRGGGGKVCGGGIMLLFFYYPPKLRFQYQSIQHKNVLEQVGFGLARESRVLKFWIGLLLPDPDSPVGAVGRCLLWDSWCGHQSGCSHHFLWDFSASNKFNRCRMWYRLSKSMN